MSDNPKQKYTTKKRNATVGLFGTFLPKVAKTAYIYDRYIVPADIWTQKRRESLQNFAKINLRLRSLLQPKILFWGVVIGK